MLNQFQLLNGFLAFFFMQASYFPCWKKDSRFQIFDFIMDMYNLVALYRAV